MARRRRILSRFGALCLSVSLALLLAWGGLAWSQKVARIVLPVEGATYPQLVERSRPLVWGALEQGFTASPQTSQVTIEVSGRNGSRQAPLFTITMPRSAWQQRPPASQLERFAVFYTNAMALLQQAPVAPPPAVAAIRPGSLRLLSSEPAPDQLGVSVNEPIQLRFDQPLPANLGEVQLGLDPQADLAFDTQQNTLLIVPQQPLRHSTRNRPRIPANAGLSLAQNVDLSFRTAPQFTYTRDIRPLLEASCVGCHQPRGRQRNQLLDSYKAVLRYVKPGDPGSTLLNPRWTGRHAPIRSALNPNLVPDSVPLVSTPPDAGVSSQVDIAPAILPSLAPPPTPGPDGEIPTFGSPELAYILQRGTPIERLGLWTPQEVEIVRVWILQDLAVEDIASQPPTS